jgi:hypothetical protein
MSALGRSQRQRYLDSEYVRLWIDSQEFGFDAETETFSCDVVIAACAARPAVSE